MPDSYLDAEAVLAAAQRTGAEAIHPGYGFLSENAAFARAVTEAGIRWVGPSPDVIESMGDKIAAKRAAVEAGVPTLPSSEDPAADAPTIEATVGYPLLVKASAGGGGKGMRIVESAVDLADAVQSAQREALSGFGDETVFLERYVASSRMSRSRSSATPTATSCTSVSVSARSSVATRRSSRSRRRRSSMPRCDGDGEAALSLARHMGYESAGTVEFLVDDARVSSSSSRSTPASRSNIRSPRR